MTPRTAACQAALSITNFRSLLKLMSTESVMPSNHLILCRPLLAPSSFPASGSFQMSQFFVSGEQSIRVSASASVLPMNTQDWFPLRCTGWIYYIRKKAARQWTRRDRQTQMPVYLTPAMTFETKQEEDSRPSLIWVLSFTLRLWDQAT